MPIAQYIHTKGFILITAVKNEMNFPTMKIKREKCESITQLLQVNTINRLVVMLIKCLGALQSFLLYFFC